MLGDPITREQEHAFRTFRHFPELLQSFAAIENLQRETGRFTIDPKDPDGVHRIFKKKEIKREIKLKSTHKLEELTHSNLGEIHALSDLRAVISKGRREIRAKEEAQKMMENGFRSASAAPKEELSPLDSAQKKLEKTSLSFDSQASVSSLLGFQGRALTKKEFHSQLWRCLNIKLSRSQLDAMFASMDVDGSGLIDGVEFIRYFFMLGNRVRQDLHLDILQKIKKLEDDKKAARQKELDDIKTWEAKQAADFTEADTERALSKLREAALRLDTSRFIDSVMLQGFQKVLTTYEFKHQCENCFLISLDSAEIGALLREFASPSPHTGDMQVDGYKFLRRLIHLQKNAWVKHKEDHKKFKDRKDRVLHDMGQRVDFLPKVLGR
jgi:hypothetical protein